MYKVLLVDDDVFNREAVGMFLQREGFNICEAGDEETARGLLAEVDAAIIDICIPPDPKTKPRPHFSYGINLAEYAKDRFPLTALVIFSAYEDRGAAILEMVRTGKRGLAYKLKGCKPYELLQALQLALEGGVQIDGDVTSTRKVVKSIRDQISTEELAWIEQICQRLNCLTTQERKVINWLAASQSYSGVAEKMPVILHTAQNYANTAYGKLGLIGLPKHLERQVLLSNVCLIGDLEQK